MQVKIESSWEKVLKPEFDSLYFRVLSKFVQEQYLRTTCYPEEDKIFNAFNLCPFHKVRVIILGQDPYHGPGQAQGLSFSVPNHISHPPSLKNIFKEIERDVGKGYPKSGDLERWALQGVLLLNATLTVSAHKAGSHQKKGWEKFTDRVISTLSEEQEGLVFMLWGGFAKKKAALINSDKHLILSSGHPSPLSANRGYWFGNKHFSRCNIYLSRVGKEMINW